MTTLEERVASMPIRSLRSTALTPACAAAILLLVFATGAKAKTVSADLRVVGPSGEPLAQLVQYTRGVNVNTDPGAQCFGPGTGGSGDRVKLPGATALGIVQDASGTARHLRPLSLTDAFEFGLGVCGIGGFQAQGDASWYLKHNHAGAQVGGDQLEIRKGDQVLWYLAPSFPYPSELALEAPGSASPGAQVDVEVVEYADDGTQRPAAGVTVSGGTSPVTTDAQGRASVALGSDEATLRATSGATIPSNEVTVCVQAGDCSPQQLIAGTGKPDRIKGTKLLDKIKARAHNDSVRARGGGPDRINCGSGRRDVAVIDPDDTVRACERVKEK
jgi:hypothetical protein